MCPHRLTQTLWASTELCLQLFLTHIPTLSWHTYILRKQLTRPFLPPPPLNSCEQKGSMWGRRRRRGKETEGRGREREDIDWEQREVHQSGVEGRKSYRFKAELISTFMLIVNQMSIFSFKEACHSGQCCLLASHCLLWTQISISWKIFAYVMFRSWYKERKPNSLSWNMMLFIWIKMSVIICPPNKQPSGLANCRQFIYGEQWCSPYSPALWTVVVHCSPNVVDSWLSTFASERKPLPPNAFLILQTITYFALGANAVCLL